MNRLIAKRIEKVRQSLAEKEIDAFMVLIGENRRYLSGFSGEDSQFDESAGSLFISQKDLVLATDARYRLQASNETEGFDIVCYQEGLIKSMPEILKRLGAERLGFESTRISHHQFQELKKVIDSEGIDIELVPTENIVEIIREIKDPVELERTKTALAIAEKAFKRVMGMIRPGMTEKEASWLMEKEMRESGADALSFPTIVASGPNSALPHAVPGDRKFELYEPILFDWGAKRDGYCSDTSRTVVLGKATKEFLDVFETVVEAQQRAISAIRNGVSSRAVDQIARSTIDDMGFKDKFGHGLGHGTGLAVHEAPRLSPLKETILKTGMLVTVEPGIYIPDWGGVRIENQVIVREEGAEVLNRLHANPWVVDV